LSPPNDPAGTYLDMFPHDQPPQKQNRQPGREAEMVPKPQFARRYAGSDRLKGKTALITGGDSGIGRP